RSRHDGAAHVGSVPGGASEKRAGDGGLPPPLRLFGRSLPDHLETDRGRAWAPAPRPSDPDRLPGSHPPGHGGSGRPVGACHAPRRTPAGRQRITDPDQGRRPPAVTAGRHRAAAFGRC
ncbi:hypothetical protein, partial [Microvirga sp. Mcv34]|uniref:hypothetical protein n=1 Tax=Microvirga sp. Mcv34 TaxID=2926016 RepID=UPI003966D417